MDHLQTDLGEVKGNVASSASTMNHSVLDLRLTDVIFVIKTHKGLVNLINWQIRL